MTQLESIFQGYLKRNPAIAGTGREEDLIRVMRTIHDIGVEKAAAWLEGNIDCRLMANPASEIRALKINPEARDVEAACQIQRIATEAS